MTKAAAMPGRRRAAGEVLAWGILLALAAILLELLLVLVLNQRRLTSIWEVQHGVLGLLSNWTLLAVPGGLLAGGLRLATISGGAPRRWVALSVLALAGATGWGVGGGRHLAALEVRLGFAIVVGLIGGFLAWLLFRPLVVILRSRTGAMVVGSTSIAASLVLVAANATLLVRLYPAFHAALSVLSVALFSFGALCQLRAHVRTRAPWAALVVLVIAGLVCIPGSKAVQGFDNFRWIVSETSVNLNWGIELASKLAPPEPLDDSSVSRPLGSRRRESGLDFRGRTVVLISVDALRADHLGTYGYTRTTSPNIDELARRGVTFQAAYAPTPHTSYSVTSLMTGKYMRPLLRQGTGADSDVWAKSMSTYGYRTAAFYPPAVFFIDTARFESFRSSQLGFEYSKVEFAEGEKRIGQVKQYLERLPTERDAFIWLHLFGPHEPYEKDARFDFGNRDEDLYDSEIRAADDTIGKVVRMIQIRDPEALIMLTADHGEEFGDHGGRYHGTTVFDEQVRVPLIVVGGGATPGLLVEQPVQTIDLLPTVLDGLKIPIPPRVRGRSLLPLLEAPIPLADDAGFAVSETDDYTLLAEANHRLICQRRSGACQLFDTSKDPAQKQDISRAQSGVTKRLRAMARGFAESHGKFESQGLRAEGKGWPAPILLGLNGNAEVAPELSLLLDDADPAIRRKCAEVLFSVAGESQTAALRLAMTREEDSETRGWLALTLTRLGQGAPLVMELLQGADPRMRRLAALALAQQGDNAGEKELIRWWLDTAKLGFDDAKQVLHAFSQLGSRDAVGPLLNRLKDVRLRPYIAEALAVIGDKDAMPHLAIQLQKERYHSNRGPLAESILRLGGDDELILPLRRFLAVPDPLPGGLELAMKAGILDELGGPKEADRRRLRQLSDSGIDLRVVVAPGPKRTPIRLVLSARTRSGAQGEIHLAPGTPRAPLKKGQVRARSAPSLQTERSEIVLVPAAELGAAKDSWRQLSLDLPAHFRAKPGHHLYLEVFAPQDVEIRALAALPRREDLPPPPPEPWKAD